MADVSVRPARPQDAERVARVQLSTWRQAYADLLPAEVLDAPEVEVAAMWLNAVEAPPTAAHRVLVALDGAELVGFAALTPVGDAAGELAVLHVDPQWGRRGHGARLLAAAVDTWRLDGVTSALAWAWESDVATLSFLRSAGWAAEGSRQALDTGAGVHTQLRLHVSLEER